MSPFTLISSANLLHKPVNTSAISAGVLPRLSKVEAQECKQLFDAVSTGVQECDATAATTKKKCPVQKEKTTAENDV